MAMAAQLPILTTRGHVAGIGGVEMTPGIVPRPFSTMSVIPDSSLPGTTSAMAGPLLPSPLGP